MQNTHHSVLEGAAQQSPAAQAAALQSAQLAAQAITDYKDYGLRTTVCWDYGLLDSQISLVDALILMSPAKADQNLVLQLANSQQT